MEKGLMSSGVFQSVDKPDATGKNCIDDMYPY
jgi:hypothetical protein